MTTNRTERAWVSTTEAALHLGVSTTAIYRGVKNGTIPHKRVGRRIFIPATYINITTGGTK